jgi:putative SOS response-associated peptidase YedK
VCGRYTHLFTWRQLHRLLELLDWPEVELSSRYNVAPTQSAPVVRLNERGERAGMLLRWGLVPSWADGLAGGSRMINARGETVFDKPAFRAAARQRRCLIPISGFYEWKAGTNQRAKTPHWIGRADRGVLCLAGLWESWTDLRASTTSEVETFTIVTTSASAFMQPLHDRMPVILEQGDWHAWLDPATERAVLERMVRPYMGSDLVAFPVGRGVNKPQRDDPGLIQPVPEAENAPDLFDKS